MSPFNIVFLGLAFGIPVAIVAAIIVWMAIHLPVIMSGFMLMCVLLVVILGAGALYLVRRS